MKVPTAVLPHTVTVRPYEGNTGYGKTWGDDVPCRARVTRVRKTVTNAQGVEVTATATVLFRPGVDVPPESKIIHGDREYDVVDVTDMDTLGATPAGLLVACA